MKKLLFTGASGFLGYNIRPLLEKAYDVHTIGLTDADDIKFNLAKEIPPINTHYDVVLHAAGKAHVVPRTEAEKQVFYDVNYQGTVNLCKALEEVGMPKALIFISTVAVYGCEFGELIDESHPLNGNSPYAKSKIMAEEYLTKILNRLILPGSLFLALIAIIPTLIQSWFGFPQSVAQLMGGTSLIILIGVDLDTMSQVEALLKMHHHEGLTKKGKIRSRNL